MRGLLKVFLALGAIWGFAHGFASLSDGGCHREWRNHHHAAP